MPNERNYTLMKQELFFIAYLGNMAFLPKQTWKFKSNQPINKLAYH